MKYEVLITKKAALEIKKLDAVVRKKIGKKILMLKNDPIKLSKRLVNSKLGEYRYRVNNYRIIFEIEENKIYILKVGHRRSLLLNVSYNLTRLQK